MEICKIIERLVPQANSDNYEVMVYPDGNWEITKWELSIVKPSLEQILAAWNTMNLDIAKQKKTDELDQACKNTILGYFTATLNGIDYQFANDMPAQNRFMFVAIQFLENKITSIDWTAYKNGQRVRITLTKDDFDIVTAAAVKHQNDNITKFNDLILNHVNVTQSVAELSQITW